MRINRFGLIIAFGFVLIVSACNVSVSTANISSFKTAADKAGSKETGSFTPGDTVYGIAVVSNAPGKVKVKATLVIDDVPGEKAGPVPGLESTLDLDGSGTATFTFSSPASGWPKGKYKIDVVMLNEQGEQKDQKSAGFSVS